LPVRVRVQNFQSIEDAEIVIDGFVVICGPNNSGKTALMRAIRGLFTNAAPGSYLRKGANFLSVEIEFDDGMKVLWEKGWEKPDQKGATVNRYTINGYQIASVGRGVPPEIEALGVKSILAGNNPTWPQVADQFDGTLFLVNKTGAVVAEALSDVERVGRLTDALRLSDKDKRAATSELKIRRDDLKGLQGEVARFKGLDSLQASIQGANSKKSEAVALGASCTEARGLQTRLRVLTESWEDLKDFSSQVPPEPQGIRAYSASLSSLRSLSSRYKALQDSCESLAGFSPPAWEPKDPSAVRTKLVEGRSYAAKLRKLQEDLRSLEDLPSLEFSDSARAERIPKVLGIVAAFKARDEALRRTLRELDDELQTVTSKAADNEDLVRQLLGERGFCPTCKTVHDGGRH
jgi:DNA repair exonuclease SbcCD ATPase subunit